MESLAILNTGSIERRILATSIGDGVLREYAAYKEQLSHNGDVHALASSGREDTQSSFSTSTTQYGDSPLDPSMASPQSPDFPIQVQKAVWTSQKEHSSSPTSVAQSKPEETAGTAPRPLDIGRPAIATTLCESPRKAKDLDHLRLPNDAASKRLSAALSDLDLTPRMPNSTVFSSLQSPCYFHQRFDDAVNIDRVLEEIIAEDDGLSHSRLMQTATSVREISKQLQRRPIRRAVRTVMIVTKARDNSLVHLTRELAEWLMSTPRYNSDLGVTVYVDEKLRNSKRFNAGSLLAKHPEYESMLCYWTPDLCWSSPEKFDLVLTLGGDGTVLFTSWLFQRIVPPVLSFSLGSLGFLTNFAYNDYKPSLDRIMGETGMRVNLRMRFTCTVFRANLHDSDRSSRKGSRKAQSKHNTTNPANTSNMVEGEQFEVLNELCIDRGPSPYVSNLSLYGDNELLTVVQADGCIISTPTGSTAYSLSAGGPLTHPSIPGILLTPICPHTLSFRPMVLSDTLLLKVCVPRTSRSTAYASFDGKGRVELRRGDCVQVEAGRYPFPTVVGEHGTGGEWFESVRRALRWNTRGAVQKGFSRSGSDTPVHRERTCSKASAVPSKNIASINEGVNANANLNANHDNVILTSNDNDNDNDDDDNDDEETQASGSDEENEEEDEDEEWDINPDSLEINHSYNGEGKGGSSRNTTGMGPSEQTTSCTISTSTSISEEQSISSLEGIPTIQKTRQ